MPGRRILLIAWLLAAAALAPARALADAAEDQYAVAAALYARGQWELASEEFAALLDEWPEHPRAPATAFYLGESLVQLERYADSRNRFEQALELDPEGLFARQAEYRVGETSFLLNDFARANDELTQFCEQHADDPLTAYALSYRGRIELEAGDARTARRLFDELLERFPDAPPTATAHLELGRALALEGDHDAALAEYERLANDSNHPLAAQAQFQAAALLYDTEQFEKADEAFARLARQWPDSQLVPKAQLGRGWAALRTKRHEDAVALLSPLANDAEIGGQALYWLGLTYKAQENWTAASGAFSQALARSDESDPALLYHAGEALVRLERHTEARPLFEQALVLGDDSQWADDAQLGLMRVAVAGNDSEQVAQVAAEFSRRFSTSPLADDVARVRARWLVEQAQYAAAIELLEPLVAASGSRAHPEDSAVSAPTDNALRAEYEADAAEVDRYLLALAYARGGDNENALKAIEPLTGTSTSNDELAQLRADAYLLEATAHAAAGDYDAAAEALELHITSSGAESPAAAAQGQLAVYRARVGRLEEARTLYGKWRAAGPAPSELKLIIRQLAEAALAAEDYTWSAELFGDLATERDDPEYRAAGLAGLAWCRYRQNELSSAADLFEQLLTELPDCEAAGQAALARGEICEKLERHDAALAMYRRALSEPDDSALRRDALLRAARLHDRLAQDVEAVALYAQFAEEYSGDPQIDRVWYEWAWSLAELGRNDEAVARFTALREQYPASPQWQGATLWLARQALAASRADEAFALAGEAASAAEAATDRAAASDVRARAAAALGRWEDVSESMQQVLDTRPDEALALQARYWLAEAAYRQALTSPQAELHYGRAHQLLEQLAAELPQERAPWMAMIPLRQAQILAQQKRWAEASEVAESVTRDFPDFAQRHEADYVIGRALASQALFAEAREAYRRVVHSPSGERTETAAMAQWMIGETYFHQESYALALREYLRVEILYAYPRWQAAALLQAGKCHEQLGEWQAAADLYRRLVDDYRETEFSDEGRRRLDAARARLAQRPSN